jgi:hypothetical protein
MSNPRQDAREIYLAAHDRCGSDCLNPDAGDLRIVEHMLRAVIEVLTPEQRAEVLAKVKL